MSFNPLTRIRSLLTKPSGSRLKIWPKGFNPLTRIRSLLTNRRNNEREKSGLQFQSPHEDSFSPDRFNGIRFADSWRVCFNPLTRIRSLLTSRLPSGSQTLPLASFQSPHEDSFSPDARISVGRRRQQRRLRPSPLVLSSLKMWLGALVLASISLPFQIERTPLLKHPSQGQNAGGRSLKPFR